MGSQELARRRWLQAAAALAGAIALPARAAWPERAVRIVVPFTPGGSTDILARAIGERLQDALGQPFVIENRPGAGGSIGATEVARAAPDGYTLLMGHIGTLAVNPSLYRDLAYDPRTSFAAVALVARVPNVLVVNPAVPVKSVSELIALAKAKPGALRYASGGNGSAAHIAMEYFKLRTQTDLLHVPYKGTAPAVTDVMGGQVEVTMTGVPAVIQQVKAGRLRALAVSSAAPVDSLPGVPTIAEATGLADFEAVQWYGIVAPARTPDAIVATLNREINRALATPALKSRLDAEGAQADPATAQAFAAMIVREIARWKPVIEQAHMRPE
ncbi:MAG TPA: tripartite tricarboxylate transporter substrate binding protein [Casimicrobiaceae bacterium]|nr:tripartite tricarboxylate transporter substrate binding protein [Casimicrobiaceae bacterium]